MFTLNNCCYCWMRWLICAVISEGPGWGCVSKHREDIMMACYNESFSANRTGVSIMNSCRQVMQICCLFAVAGRWFVWYGANFCVPTGTRVATTLIVRHFSDFQRLLAAKLCVCEDAFDVQEWYGPHHHAKLGGVPTAHGARGNDLDISDKEMFVFGHTHSTLSLERWAEPLQNDEVEHW